jgi:hypothetical protein
MMRAIFWIGRSGILGSAIRAYKLRGVSHAELLFSDGIAGTSDREKGGVVLYDLGRPSKADWVAIDLPDHPAGEERARALIASELGAGYDWLGIALAQVLPWGRQDPRRWFCSELVAAALARAYPASMGDVIPHRLDPAGLLDLLVRRAGDLRMEAARDRAEYGDLPEPQGAT